MKIRRSFYARPRARIKDTPFLMIHFCICAPKWSPRAKTKMDLDVSKCIDFTKKKNTRNGHDFAKLLKLSARGVPVLDLGPRSSLPPVDKCNNFARSCRFLVLFFLVKCWYQKTSKSVFVLRLGLHYEDRSIFLCSTAGSNQGYPLPDDSFF